MTTETQAKHEQEKWEAKIKDIFLGKKLHLKWIGTGGFTGRPIASVEKEADAILFAGAAELLEALKELQKGITAERVEQAEKAIAKAEGK